MMQGFRVQGSGFRRHGRHRAFPEPRTLNPEPSGFTLLEMLTTVAALVIVLGLMVSLARDVRNRSADRVTKDLLVRLERLMAQYQTRHGGAIPQAAALSRRRSSSPAISISTSGRTLG